MPLPAHPNVRNCTHIKVTGQRCGSPALRGEFFCYFHTRVIKGVQQRVDMQLHSMALLEDAEAIQFSLMLVVDGLVKGTLDPTRARLIIQALRIAARNAKEARFDNCYYEESEQPMVREVPNYARQYLIEHPEFGPPIHDSCGAGAPAREPDQDKCGAGAPAREDNQHSCSADTPVREAKATTAQCKAQAASPEQNAQAPKPAVAPEQNPSQENPTEEPAAIACEDNAPTEPAAKRRHNTAHGASRGTNAETNSAPQERKNPTQAPANRQSADGSKERELIQQAEAAIPGALAGNWRDLRTVFEFAGISERSKDI
jgi:hypothetical protein